MGWNDVRAALAETDPRAKCRRVDRLWADVDSGAFVPRDPGGVDVPDVGRPERPARVHPSALPRRGLGSVEGRVALLHAVAHIEFNAINLGLDASLRFPGMPDEFYRDWLSVAADEARHFRLLAERLDRLGAAYGDLPAHNGLWDMAEKTADDVLVRMALVPRVLEARGLDVTPGMIDKLRAVGDLDSVACLEVILEEEVRHVAIGSRWFRFCCEGRDLDPEPTFRGLLRDHFGGALRGPFNHSARREAGFSAPELEALEAMA
ncbi:ferritin-like domain-containing protein [Wenzhouxiangella sp. XN79A]|uniref:ferritin-like domain-containing protein n=1 Tax=Wenzhouxiangella sp. XN79A TaxID=2724193 RepID=UPI00144A6C78|nr:ferritin-like domain-containing protein [Wenzhouxiangella sp. XN79A]NKI34462.1 ferritin-like domain-containing protein [Wenzhouxiangella sp. XN79A]